MTDENKKPEKGFHIDDEDVDAMLGIIRHRDEEEHKHTNTPAQSSGSSAMPPSLSQSGQASSTVPPSPRTGNPPEKTPSFQDQKTPGFASGSFHAPSSSSSPSADTPAGTDHRSAGGQPEPPLRRGAGKNTSRARVVDFDEVDPENARRRRAKQLKKNAATGKSAAIGLFKTLLYLVCVAGISVFLAVNIINIGNDVYAFVKDDIRTTVTLPEGATLDEVADLLKENGIIRYPWVFKLYTQRKFNGSDYYTGTFKSGDIRFLFLNEGESESTDEQTAGEDMPYADYVKDSAGKDDAREPMNYDKIISLVAASDYKERDTVRITIPEGYTVDEILDLLIANGVGEREKYVDAIQNYEYDYRFVTELDATGTKEGRRYRLEGYLFPDTYDFFTDESEISVINKLLANFDAKMESVYYDRADELGMSVDDVIILASIIEKEARFAADLPLMASVFYNRLSSGIRLHSDATVMYALPERKTSLSSADLEVDSPYNTYKVSGLTPGAISNPGIEAINAAFYPDSTNYYYFFSLKDGSTVYSATYDQHTAKLNKAIAEGTLAS